MASVYQIRRASASKTRFTEALARADAEAAVSSGSVPTHVPNGQLAQRLKWPPFACAEAARVTPIVVSVSTSFRACAVDAPLLCRNSRELHWFCSTPWAAAAATAASSGGFDIAPAARASACVFV